MPTSSRHRYCSHPHPHALMWFERERTALLLPSFGSVGSATIRMQDCCEYGIRGGGVSEVISEAPKYTFQQVHALRFLLTQTHFVRFELNNGCKHYCDRRKGRPSNRSPIITVLRFVPRLPRTWPNERKHEPVFQVCAQARDFLTIAELTSTISITPTLHRREKRASALGNRVWKTEIDHFATFPYFHTQVGRENENETVNKLRRLQKWQYRREHARHLEHPNGSPVPPQFCSLPSMHSNPNPNLTSSQASNPFRDIINNTTLSQGGVGNSPASPDLMINNNPPLSSPPLQKPKQK